MSAIKIVLASLMALTFAGSESSAAQTPAQPVVVCAYIGPSRVSIPISPPLATEAERAAAEAKSIESPTVPTSCSSASTTARGILVGSSDIYVVVTRKSWAQAIAVPAQSTARPKLFLNGIAAGSDDALVSTELDRTGTVTLRYHVAADKSTRELWVALYREQPLFARKPLSVSLGWSTAPTTLPAERGPQIQITSELRFYIALAAISLLTFLFIAVAKCTNVFRDSPATEPVMRNRGRTVPRLRSYSLARMQVGIWLLFLIASAIYIWLVLGELPTPIPSLVGLVTLSAVTTAASITVDGRLERVTRGSDGLLNDLLTGPDGSQQLHRIQALAVNGLLLVASVYAVIDNLSYMEIEGPWLALVGLSGIAQTVGKGALEKETGFPEASKGIQQSLTSLPSGRTV